MRVLLACLLLGACSSAPRRSSDSGSGEPAPDAGGVPVDPGVDAAPGMPIVDPPPGTPTARLMGFPLDIDFGTVNIGAAVRTNAVVITNVGDAATRALQAALTSAPDLRLTSNCMGRSLRSGETCVVTAEFEPRMVGMSLVMGSIDDGAGGLAPITFTARGTGRLGPDAGPDVARPLPDAGADMAGQRDLAASPDVARDLGADLAAPRDLAADRTADSRD